MKTTIINRVKGSIAFACVGLMLLPFTLQAQNRTGYFLEGNTYGHYLNPAFSSDRGYFSFPFLGNFNLETQGNVGYNNFIYKQDNGSKYKQTTFMNSTVSASDFLGDLDDKNIIHTNLNMTLLSLGFKGFGGYNTIGLSLRSQAGMNLPYEMFEFMKVMGNNNYAIKDLNMQTKNFADLSFGHSRKINDRLTVGAKVKLLFGLAYAQMNFDRIDISMSGDRWQINADGTADVAVGGEFTYDNDDIAKVDGYDDAKFGIRGFGMGLDLGAVYDLSEAVTEGLTLSAAILDLGYISWKDASSARIKPDEPYTFDGFESMGIHSDSENKPLEDQFDDVRDDLEDFFTLRDDGKGSKTTGIGATLNMGAEYKMPFYDKLSAGLLFTHCFDGVYSWTEGRLSFNVAPVSWFDLALSGGLNTYGTSLGWLANLHMPGFNLFFGTDCLWGKTTKQFIPLNDMNMAVNFGINFCF